MRQPSPDALRWIALFGATAVISILFIGMVQPFLVALVLAAITASMASRLQARMMDVTHQRPGLAAALTLAVLSVAVLAPLLGVAYLAAQQAQGMSDSAGALVAELQSITPEEPLPDWVPFRDQIGSRSADIMAKFGELTEALSGYAATALGQLAAGTAEFFLNLFVYVYALFLFLQMDRSVIDQVLSYSGLPERTQTALAERMISISRATLKGTLVIGVAQGVLGGLGFWATGIEGAVFWGVVMAVLSVIPGLGPLLIVFGGVLWLLAQGDLTMALGLAVWGVAVVGTIDNILRPVLVGRDTALHDVLILISTLGGLAVFGAAGLVLGPVLAGLFVTLWDTLVRTTHDTEDNETGQDETGEDDRAKPASDVLDEDLARELQELRRKHQEREARKDRQAKRPSDAP